jgi:choline dehydrogenase
MTEAAESFDYVIVGAGAAGCVLANRLSANPKHRVLVLEAGGPDTSPWIRIPAGFTKTLVDPKVNWCYQTTPDEGTANRSIWYPRGKTLGGSSSINGHLYVRGQRHDYDHWAQLGNRGWGYGDVLPFFRKAETREGGDPEFRGTDGPLQIQDPRDPAELLHLMVDAVQQCGVPKNPDYNGWDQEGCGLYQNMMKHGRRWSAADAYLKPAMARPNLKVVTHALAEQVLLEGRRAIGVAYRRAGKREVAQARVEVILAGGAVNSPQLLQLSGVGPAELLRRHGIEVCHALPGVGRNLRDHIIARISVRAKGIRTINERAHGLPLALEIAKYFLFRKGILTMAPGQGYAFTRSRPELEAPDLQFAFAPATYADVKMGAAAVEREPGMTCGGFQLRPESQGTLEIVSADPAMPPSIRPNYLADEIDRRSAIAAGRQARAFLKAPVLKPYYEHETVPGPAVESDDEWLDYVRQNGGTTYHPIGSCKMGQDEMAVVDHELRVRGLERLRVVDASIMPTMSSGNTYAPTNMIAEKGADLVLRAAAG